MTDEQKEFEELVSVVDIQTPFKCYIYKTKKRILRDVAHKGEALWGCEKIADKTEIVSCPDLDGGKVIGEFVCDRISSFCSCSFFFSYLRICSLKSLFSIIIAPWGYR